MAAAWSPGELGPLLRFLERRLSRASALTLSHLRLRLRWRVPPLANGRRQQPKRRRARWRVRSGPRVGTTRTTVTTGTRSWWLWRRGRWRRRRRSRRPRAARSAGASACRGRQRRRVPSPVLAVSGCPGPPNHCLALQPHTGARSPPSLREWRLAHARPRCTHLPASGHPRRRARGDGAGASFGGGG